MSATPSERSRASRLRRARDAGTINARDRSWLAKYESKRATRDDPQRDDTTLHTEARAPEPAPASARDERPVPVFVDLDDDEPADDPSREGASDDANPFDDDDDDDDASDDTHDTERCPAGPECPQCRGAASGGKVCITTGNRVYPPMTMDGARGLASAVLNLIGIVVRIFRDDKRLIVPSDSEVDGLAEAIREMAHRRMSWVSAVDDLIAFGYNVTKYTMRAAREPHRGKVKPPARAKRDEPRDDTEAEAA